MKLIRFGTLPDGCPYLLLRASRGELRELVVTISTAQPAEWLYGYVIHDHATKTSQSFHGPFGDPDRDTPGRFAGFE